MGGKTGTAQKISSETGTYGSDYLVSFIGFAPLDDPQVVVYTVVDQPNAEYQADSKFAQYLSKQIMREILPYLNIFPDEEETGEENGEMVYFENLMEQKSVENAGKIAQGYSVEDQTQSTGETDTDGDGTADTGTDTDGDGVLDTGTDTDGDGILDTASGTGDQDTGTASGEDSTDTGTSSQTGESQEAGSEQGAENGDSIVPPEDEEEVTGGQKEEDGGITNEDAQLQSGN